MGFPSCPGEIATEGFSRCPGVAFVEAKAAWMAFRRCSDPADLTVGAGACATALKESPEAKKFGLSRFEVGAKKEGSMNVLQQKEGLTCQKRVVHNRLTALSRSLRRGGDWGGHRRIGLGGIKGNDLHFGGKCKKSLS